jgi:predicted nucleic-acid-binding protein
VPQCALTHIFAAAECRLTGLALAALVKVLWVLGHCYGVEREQIKDIVEAMTGTKERVVEGADTVRKALRVFVTSAKVTGMQLIK